jgi:hypothetical protein
MNNTMPLRRPGAALLPDTHQQPDNPRWFFRFFVVYAIVMLVLLGLLYVDFFAHLAAPDPIIGSVAYRLFVGLALVPAGLIIAVLVLRRTHQNVTGLLLLIYATTVMVRTLRIDSPLQVLSNAFSTGYIGFFLLPLYFPDGTVYPLRFQRLIRMHSIVTAILFAASVLFIPTVEIYVSVGQLELAPNPLLPAALQAVAEPINTIQGLTWISSVLLIIPSILLRLRASRGLVRQQIKVFVWAFSLIIGIFIILVFIFPPDDYLNLSEYGLLGLLNIVYTVIVFPAAPFAVVGYAILRHRLYDIDIIIRRTVTYSLMTAILAGAYFGAVTVLQAVFARLIGGESALAIVISTLVIAALFTPVRRRVQDFIDRRFYRQKYDAGKTLERFGETVRDEIDIDGVEGALLRAVRETMQPESARLWLAQPEK